MKKRTWACLLAVCLLTAALIPVARGEGPLFRFNGGSPKNETSEIREDQQSLWGRDITAIAAEIPKEAIEEREQRAILLSGDGRRLLISGGPSPYLWDLETHQKTRLFLGDEATKDVARQMVESAKGMAASRKTPIPSRPASGFIADDLLADFLWFARSEGRYMPLLPAHFVHTMGHFLFVSDGIGRVWALNDQTGALYCRERGTPTDAREDTLLIRADPPGATVTLVDLASGQETILDFSDAGGFEHGASITGAAFLSDGSVCAVLRDITLRAKEGQACVLAVRREDGQVETYALGKIRLGQEPDILCSVGNDQIVMYSQRAVSRNAPYLVNRATGEVSLLNWDGRTIQATGLKLLLDWSNFTVKQPAGKSILPIGPCADGETLLMYSLDGYVLLFRPATLESRYLLGDAEASSMPIPHAVSGNGYDRMLILPFTSTPQLIRLIVQ